MYMHLLIHLRIPSLMNSVLHYFHIRLLFDLFFMLDPYLKRFYMFHSKYKTFARRAVKCLQKTIFSIVINIISLRSFVREGRIMLGLR